MPRRCHCGDPDCFLCRLYADRPDYRDLFNNPDPVRDFPPPERMTHDKVWDGAERLKHCRHRGRACRNADNTARTRSCAVG